MRQYGTVRVSEDPDPDFHFYADPDLAFHIYADPYRIRILRLIKVMRICDHWPTYRPA
jgi:hypothetical protein